MKNILLASLPLVWRTAIFAGLLILLITVHEEKKWLEPAIPAYTLLLMMAFGTTNTLFTAFKSSLEELMTIATAIKDLANTRQTRIIKQIQEANPEVDLKIPDNMKSNRYHWPFNPDKPAS